MSSYQFGIGGLFANPSTTNPGTPAGPTWFGTIQEASVEFSRKLEKLRGQNVGPDDVAPSDMEIKGKATFGKIDINIYNTLFFGDTVTQGMGGTTVYQTPQGGATPIPTTPFHITPTVPGSGTWVTDLGVTFSNGQPLTRVASGPTTGQYSVAAGVYTFASADNVSGLSVMFAFAYTVAAAGQQLVTFNKLQGVGPTFGLYLLMPYQENNLLYLATCRSSKMSAPLKRNGYLISDFEFEAYPGPTGQWVQWYQADSSF